MGSGAAMVAAGPGTGKTHVLAARLIGLLSEPAAAATPAPGAVLALTFTQAAAQTLRQRVEGAIPIDRGESCRDHEICTMHAFARVPPRWIERFLSAAGQSLQ